MTQPSTRRSGPNTPPALFKNNDVFISYSRKDKAFLQSLDAVFREVKRDLWIDWDDIRKGEDWWRSIRRGIEAADTFLFVGIPMRRRMEPGSLFMARCGMQPENRSGRWRYNTTPSM